MVEWQRRRHDRGAGRDMSVPDYQTLMEPVLRIVDRHGVPSVRELADRVATELRLTEQDRRQTIQSGMGLLQNRVHWAVTYLFKAKAVNRPRRGHVEITDRGRGLLHDGRPIRNSTLEQFPEYREFYDSYRRRKTSGVRTSASSSAEVEETPDDLIARAELQARSALMDDLLQKVRGIDPTAFERLVVKLLQRMGYGNAGAVEHSGASGDEGVDGIISQDPLGLDRIYIKQSDMAPATSYIAPRSMGSSAR